MTADSAALLGGLGRWLGFIGTLLVIGAAVYRFGALPTYQRVTGAAPAGALDRTATLGLGAAVLLLVAGPIRLAAQAMGFVDPGEPITGELLRTILGETAWGRGWALQLLAGGLAIIAFLLARVAPQPGWLMAAAAATTVILAAPLTGHATAAARAGSWGYPLDALHVLGTGTWLGTLAVVLVAGLPGARHGARGTLTALVMTFSPIALTGFAFTAVSGLAMSVRYLDGSVSALWTSTYGQVLLLKLGAVAVVLALGAYNWRRLTARMEEEGGARRLQWSAGSELALTAVVLAVTAVLVSLPMPGE